MDCSEVLVSEWGSSEDEERAFSLQQQEQQRLRERRATQNFQRRREARQRKRQFFVCSSSQKIAAAVHIHIGQNAKLFCRMQTVRESLGRTRQKGKIRSKKLPQNREISFGHLHTEYDRKIIHTKCKRKAASHQLFAIAVEQPGVCMTPGEGCSPMSYLTVDEDTGSIDTAQLPIDKSLLEDLQDTIQQRIPEKIAEADSLSDYLLLNDDERALWLTQTFIKYFQNERTATPGSMSRPLRRIQEILGNYFPSNCIGPGPLRIKPGFRCLYTGQLSAVGLHCSFNDRVSISCDDDGLPTATSLLLNDDCLEDFNDLVVVYGDDNEGKSQNANLGDQVLSAEGKNLRTYALWLAWKAEYPLRVIRGYKCKSRYAPPYGYRYDGLFRVVEMLVDSSNASSPQLPLSAAMYISKQGTPYKKKERSACTEKGQQGRHAADTKRGGEERRPLEEGRRIHKFVLMAIHPQFYLAEKAKFPLADFADFNDALCDSNRLLRKCKSFATRQYRVHVRVQGQLIKNKASGTSHSRTTKTVLIHSDLPFTFALVVPPAVRHPDLLRMDFFKSEVDLENTNYRTVPTSFHCIRLAAYKIYDELKKAFSEPPPSQAASLQNRGFTTTTTTTTTCGVVVEDTTSGNNHHQHQHYYHNNHCQYCGWSSAFDSSSSRASTQLFTLKATARATAPPPPSTVNNHTVSPNFAASTAAAAEWLLPVLLGNQQHCVDRLSPAAAAQIPKKQCLKAASAAGPKGQTSIEQAAAVKELLACCCEGEVLRQKKEAARRTAAITTADFLPPSSETEGRVSAAAADLLMARRLATEAVKPPSHCCLATLCWWWQRCGFLPMRLILTRIDFELRSLSESEKMLLIEQTLKKKDQLTRPPVIQKKPPFAAAAAAASSWTPLEEAQGGDDGLHIHGAAAARTLHHPHHQPCLHYCCGTTTSSSCWVQPAASRAAYLLLHRPFVWTETRTEILISSELAKAFALHLLPQSQTCGIYASLELCEPLPRDWLPWQDISQGKERFPLPAVNDIDGSSAFPTNFSYQVRNVITSRLPNYSMLCLCAGCIPPSVNTSTWERIEVEGYNPALRDPATGNIYCRGSNLPFIRQNDTLAVCTSYCLCNKAVCSNLYPEDLQFPVFVAKTSAAGWELRTQVPIPPKAFIMQYVGEMICRAQMEGRSRHNSRKGYHNFCMEMVQDERQWEDNWKAPCIDSLYLGNASRFLNHSCEPNCSVRTIWRGPLLPLVGVFASRSIAAGEPLTYAYGGGYEVMKCVCSTASCIGYIGGYEHTKIL